MNVREKIVCATLALLLVAASGAEGQLGAVDRAAAIKPTLMILGTYHMGTPGNNMVNGKVDDISSPERQKQLVQLVARLKKFKPTKVVVECDLEDDPKMQELYDRYLAGTYSLSKDETNQIGFRLAREAGLKKVHCVDWSDFWDDPAINYEKFVAGDRELESFLKGIYRDLEKEVAAEHEELFTMPVIDQLALLNQPDRIERSHQLYYEFIRIGRAKEYAGAGYVAWWYRRNLVILDNIIRLTESPRERLLVIYGAGHLKLLTQFAKESGFYKVESPLTLLK